MKSLPLALALAMLATGCATSPGSGWSSTTSDCPPVAVVSDTPSTTLAFSGTGVAPREVTSVPFGSDPRPASPRLVAGGTGVGARLETDPATPAAGASTPHLAAGGTGVGARVECPR